MPVVRITAPESLTADQLSGVADGVHRAMVQAIGIPQGDRFQLLLTHPADAFSFDGEYLGVARREVVCIEITLVAGRTDDRKRDLYRRVADNLAAVGVRREDVFVVLTENQSSDWSVGNGEAQLLDIAEANARQRDPGHDSSLTGDDGPNPQHEMSTG